MTLPLRQVISYLYYCRPGYESDLANELETFFAEHNCYGYAKYQKKCGFVEYFLYESPKTFGLSSAIRFEKLIFARQQLFVAEDLNFENDSSDRISLIVEKLKALEADVKVFGNVFCEYPDTDDDKKISKFCKKFSVPLRNRLRKNGLLTEKPDQTLPFLHLFFRHSLQCFLCFSMPKFRSPHFLGIPRLKFPKGAPSRSTLKLEEAINEMIPKRMHSALFQKGMTSVDLGASPGGWTYQMVSRGIEVEAVDNGTMSEALLQTGLVKHFNQDGFLYEPVEKHVDWLLCDMIEKPDRVARLMSKWLTEKKSTSTIFNLKLPMQKRFFIVSGLLQSIKKELSDKNIDFSMRLKHLYHNRDEVTVVILTGQHRC